MPLQGQALKTVARPQADEHPLETCGLHRGGGLRLRVTQGFDFS